MTVVCIQHQGLLMQSVQSVSSSDAGISFGGASSNNSGGARTKENGSIWDEEW